MTSWVTLVKYVLGLPTGRNRPDFDSLVTSKEREKWFFWHFWPFYAQSCNSFVPRLLQLPLSWNIGMSRPLETLMYQACRKRWWGYAFPPPPLPWIFKKGYGSTQDVIDGSRCMYLFRVKSWFHFIFQYNLQFFPHLTVLLVIMRLNSIL